MLALGCHSLTPVFNFLYSVLLGGSELHCHAINDHTGALPQDKEPAALFCSQMGI